MKRTLVAVSGLVLFIVGMIFLVTNLKSPAETATGQARAQEGNIIDISTLNADELHLLGQLRVTHPTLTDAERLVLARKMIEEHQAFMAPSKPDPSKSKTYSGGVCPTHEELNRPKLYDILQFTFWRPTGEKFNSSVPAYLVDHAALLAMLQPTLQAGNCKCAEVDIWNPKTIQAQLDRVKTELPKPQTAHDPRTVVDMAEIAAAELREACQS